MVHMGITSAYEAGSVLGMRPQLREFSTSENSEFATHDYVWRSHYLSLEPSPLLY